MPYDIGEFDLNTGEWRAFDGDAPNPWPIGARVIVDGAPGTVTSHGRVDDLSFRVTFDNGEWGKYASWQLESERP